MLILLKILLWKINDFNPTIGLPPVPAYSSHQAYTKLHLYNPLFLHTASAPPIHPLIEGAFFCHFQSMAFCPRDISEVSAYPYTVNETESAKINNKIILRRIIMKTGKILHRDHTLPHDSNVFKTLDRFCRQRNITFDYGQINLLLIRAAFSSDFYATVS